MRKILFSALFVLILAAVLAAAVSAQDRFTDNGDGTITDSSTGLMWQKGQSQIKNWAGIMSYCDSLTLGGSSDWRAPTKAELDGIFAQTSRSCGPSAGGDYSTSYSDRTFDCHESTVWSSTEYDSENAYFIDFATKNSGYGSKTGGVFAVRCVSSGTASTVSQACTDSDKGKDYFTAGKVMGLYSDDKQTGIIWGERLDYASVRYDKSLSYSVYYDHCADSEASDPDIRRQLNEGYCENGIIQSVGITCEYGCENGACTKSPETTPQITKPVVMIGCKDSDHGLNYYVKGYGTVTFSDGMIGTNEEMCYDQGTMYGDAPAECAAANGFGNGLCVIEQLCYANGTQGYDIHMCPNGCKDGACISGTTQTCALTEKDCPMICADCAIGYSGGGCSGGVDYDTCTCKRPEPCVITSEVKETVTCFFEDGSGEQKCYSEKGSCTKYLGEAVKCEVGGKCETLPQEPPVCKVEVSGKKGEKVTWKSSCGGYGYTTMDGDDEVVKFDCSNAPTPTNATICAQFMPPYCPNGILVSSGFDENGCPRPPKCVEEIEDNLTITKKCDAGCEYEGTCVHYGFRAVKNLEPQLYMYCNINGQFNHQKHENAECQNDYECQSNQCSNGKCIDLEKQLKETQGMLDKIYSWLSKLFGSKKTDIKLYD